MRFAKFAAFSLAAVMLVAMPGMADTLTFTFTSDHCTGDCLPDGAANMGTVVVTDSGVDTVDVSVQLAAGFGFVHTGAGTGDDGSAAFFFRLSGEPTITYSDITTGWIIPNVIGTDQQAAGAYAGDGLMNEFTYALECFPAACGNGGSSPAPSPLNFTVSATGLTAASFNDPGTSGSPFAADVISSNGNTGLIDASLCQVDCGGDLPPVPEPSSMLLMGGGLLGLALWRKRKSS
jgi:hypothetical protein